MGLLDLAELVSQSIDLKMNGLGRHAFESLESGLVPSR
jgi:hypothetical protein